MEGVTKGGPPSDATASPLKTSLQTLTPVTRLCSQ